MVPSTSPKMMEYADCKLSSLLMCVVEGTFSHILCTVYRYMQGNQLTEIGTGKFDGLGNLTTLLVLIDWMDSLEFYHLHLR